MFILSGLVVDFCEQKGEFVFIIELLLQVLFQNDSPASLLARVMGIVGSFDNEMLTKGRDSHKYFTKNQMLYERNQVSFFQRP